MRSPRYAPAGLLVERGRVRVMIDGGPGAVPRGKLDAWLVTDERAELIRELRVLARGKGLEPRVAGFEAPDEGLWVRPLRVVHTSHPAFGYRIDAGGIFVAWAPEFFEVPSWIAHFDLVFADAAGWSRPIRFAGGVGGHACALDVAREAEALGVRRLVFAHVGRPTIRALDAGEVPPFGEIGSDGDVFVLEDRRLTPASRRTPRGAARGERTRTPAPSPRGSLPPRASASSRSRRTS